MDNPNFQQEDNIFKKLTLLLSVIWIFILVLQMNSVNQMDR